MIPKVNKASRGGRREFEIHKHQSERKVKCETVFFGGNWFPPLPFHHLSPA
jgi:hypothetical protein